VIHLRAREIAFDTASMLRMSFRWRVLAQTVVPSGVRNMLVRYLSGGDRLMFCLSFFGVLLILSGADLDQVNMVRLGV